MNSKRTLAMREITNDLYWPIVLKKSVLQTARALTPENAFFARSYAKSEPEILCSKQRIQSQARTFLPWKPWPTFSTESADSSRTSMAVIGPTSDDG